MSTARKYDVAIYAPIRLLHERNGCHLRFMYICVSSTSLWSLLTWTLKDVGALEFAEQSILCVFGSTILFTRCHLRLRFAFAALVASNPGYSIGPRTHIKRSLASSKRSCTSTWLVTTPPNRILGVLRYTTVL
jgi:hypothetical protein